MALPLAGRRGRVQKASQKEATMGFMDKAKKMAEQAQQKIDEKQKQWNQREPQEDAPGAGAVVFDDHGRPVPNETSEAQAEVGIPVGESMQAEPGTIPAGASQSEGEPESAHAPVEGDRPEGVDHPGEGQPPAGRVEKSGAAGNAEENRGS
jgi:hypothetical protein